MKTLLPAGLRYLFIILLLVNTSPAHAQWSYVGGNISPNNTYPAHYSLAVDTAGMPYVAFADLGNSYIVTVKKLQNGIWANVGTPGFITGTGASSGLFYNQGTAIAINPTDNSPWLALADGDNDNKISVMRFNGVAWVYVGNAGFTALSSCGIKMAFTTTGTPYIVYNACYDGAGLSSMYFNGTNWVYAGVQHFATGNYFNLAISPDNTIAVAFQDQDNDYKVSVRRFNGANWVYMGNAGFSNGNIQNVNITANAANEWYVCYTDYSDNEKLTVKKLTGSTWATVGSPAFSQFTAAFSDISVNRFGVPYVSYVDGGRAVVRKFTNGSWNMVANQVTPGLSQHTSMFNDSLGNPWVLTAIQSLSTLPFMLRYKPCNDADYGFTANVSSDSAITQTGGSTTITITATGGVAPYTGTGNFEVTAGYYSFTVTDANGCSIPLNINVTEPQPVCTENYWLGMVSTDWTDINNWSCASVPGDITTVYIEAGAGFYPVITTQVVCKEMIVASGITVTVAAEGKLNIVGN